MTFNLKKLNKLSFILALIIIIIILLFGNRINIFNNLSNKVDMMEGTEEEISLDNWEISTVFYDSTVDGGVTPLTEINWDASDGSYKKGEARIITIQINYKNSNAVTTYQPGELEISIPNLIYNTSNLSSAFWNAEIIVGANDTNHSGYDWNFISNITNVQVPSIHHENLVFTNATTIEEKNNLEGSIQIVYTITPQAETTSDMEKYLNDCIHSYSRTLKATLKGTKTNIEYDLKEDSVEKTISSKGWPYENYENNLVEEENTWIYESEKYQNLALKFDSISKTESGYDYINIYDKNGNKVYSLTGSSFAGKTYHIDGNYVKITMKSDGSSTYKGFSVDIGESELKNPNEIHFSNEIELNYTRTYIHPWSQRTYSIYKTASKIESLDGFPQGDYYWVKYTFQMNGRIYAEYPYVAVNYYIEDYLPSDCVVLDYKFEKQELENGKYTDSSFSDSWSSKRYEYIYVGYPKEKYNDELNNLSIKNAVNLYIKYGNEEEYRLVDDSEISINLSDFEFAYIGELYTVNKEYAQYADKLKLYSNFLLDEDYEHNCNYCTGNWQTDYIGRHPTTATKWYLDYEALYTGKPLTIQAGDDLLYITDSNNNYRRLSDQEYYIEYIYLPKITNKNKVKIEYTKYNIELYVRYANEDEYTFYKNLNNNKAFEKIEFTDKKVVAYYIQIEGATESLILSNRSGSSNDPDHGIAIQIKPIGNISPSGKIYNFNFLNVYFEENGKLVLQNEVTINSYSNIMTQNEIANFDLAEYGRFIQRSESFVEYSEFNNHDINIRINSYTYFKSIIQNVEMERFELDLDIGVVINGSYDFVGIASNSDYINDTYISTINNNMLVKGFKVYNLLPKGMNINISPEELISTISIFEANGKYYEHFYKVDGSKAFTSYNDMIDFFKKNSEIKIIENWKDTGRTKIEWIVDFENDPLLDVVSTDSGGPKATITLPVYVNYDDYIEYGKNWKAYTYIEGFYMNDKKVLSQNFSGGGTTNDDGNIEQAIVDINENGNTEETLGISSSSKTISSVISTHQDITTYVQTDQNNYSTGVVEATYGFNYEYKLRARTGSSDVTNLILYTNIEEGYNGRGHWKGDFLGIDTSYAESKGYTVKTYYSEKTNATNMKDDTSWKVYDDTVDKTKVKSLAFQYLDSNGNPAVLPANSLTYVLIKMKSPDDENIKTLAYNNCWTQWNAIDPITEQPVDFITGINSNTVKISLPNSVEYVDIELDLEKKWIDNDNEFGLRPSSIQYNIIANNDKENMLKVTMYNTDKSLNNGNIWTKTIEVPKYDEEGNIITYTIDEELTSSDNIYYVPSITNYSITNTLSKDLTINKVWLDNNNAYVTRPTGVIVKVLQNSELFKEVEIKGELSTNEWTKTISVPIYDENGNEYTYTFEEQSIDGYNSSFDSTTNTFTNTLSVDTTIIVTKNWKDNTNKYGLRPSNINVNIKQNNQVYKTITLSGTTDTWKSEELTIPMYDNQGIKYNYTIEEETVKGYGLVEYNQETLTITNTLKETTTLIVTKNWIDDSNSSHTRPTNLSVTILQNNKEFKTITLSGNTNTWTSNIEVPKYDENQNEYTYTIKENNENIITEYSDVLYGEDGLTVTNKLNKNIDLTITKKWKDFDNEYLTRPDTVIINLYRNNILYQELTLMGENNSWSTKVTNVPAYDDNGKKYIYTIEEVSNDKLSKYEKITYDQTTLTVTNEMLNPPKVTLYFTVQNGYTEAGSDEVKFDEEGYKKVLEKYNINGDEDYTYTFELQNVETGEIYKGQLTTSGVLTFENISYGTYRAIEGKDEYFDFVEMLGIVEIPGVSFKEDENGGIITIKPTGEDITYGVNIVNKISMIVDNPPTTAFPIYIILIVIIITLVSCCYFIQMKKEF